MLRAIRFSGKLHFELAEETAAPLNQLSSLISNVSGSRLFEEMIKLYQCGEAKRAQEKLELYGLFAKLFTQTSNLLQSNYPASKLIALALESTDSRINEGKTVNPAFVFAIFLWFPLLEKTKELKDQGVDPLPALDQAMSLVISEQNKVVTIPKRFTQVMREIWLMQYRFPKRLGHRAFNIIEHPRFRAAYDFLALRALAGDESIELADWWTTFQEVDDNEKNVMIEAITKKSNQKSQSKKSTK